MDHATRAKVAVVRTDRRRGGVAEALALIADELRSAIQGDPNPIIVPNLDVPARPWACTHRDTVSATVDAVLAAGADSITIASTAASIFDRLAYRSECWDRPVCFPTPDSTDKGWSRIHATSPCGTPISFRVPRPVAVSRCRIALGVARTHGVFRVGLGMTNLVSHLHPDDRRLLGATAPWGIASVPGVAATASLLESGRGMLARTWLGLRSISAGMRLTPRESRRLQAIEEATSRLTTLASLLNPTISVVDGFIAMQGQGPDHGRRASLGVVIAGTDAVAVDAVAAAIMGFEPMEVPYLRQTQALGLGVATLASIAIVGDPIAEVRRPLRRHSSDRMLRLVHGPTAGRPLQVPGPHFDISSSRSEPGTATRADHNSVTTRTRA